MRQSDFLVIGSGIAGLMYALEVAEHGSVIVLCKSDPSEGSTRYAQGGIASVTSPLDSFESHIQDTIESGAGLCDSEVVETVVREGPDRVQQLIDIGTRFDTSEDSVNYDLGREGGHSKRRILHAGDATGAEVQRAIFAKASSHPNIEILPHHIAIDLICPRTPHETLEVLGAYAFSRKTGKIITFTARTTLLASGGAGKAYLYTSNPDVSTGDGVGMAYRAGAKVANMEFIQFHPTCLYHPEAKSFLITEAMRGEGAKLLSAKGEEFLEEHHPEAELATRDIVARAIDKEMKSSGADYVLLDISHRSSEFIKGRFPTIYKRTKELGFDITEGPIPVVPAAHYTCGGVLSNIHGRSSIDRLYVAGEVSCTGLHGGNRLASNSLLEALVFSHRAAKDSIKHLHSRPAPNNVSDWDYVDAVKSSEEVLISHSWDEVRRLMWNLVGIIRSDHRLELAARRLKLIEDEIQEYYWDYRVTSDLIELRNIITVSKLIVRSAQSRRESRGLHYNVDCPEQDRQASKNTVLQRTFRPSTEPVDGLASLS